MKTLIELKMLKKKAQMDQDEELEKVVDHEILELLMKADSNGKKEEAKKRAIERRRNWYAKKKDGSN